MISASSTILEVFKKRVKPGQVQKRFGRATTFDNSASKNETRNQGLFHREKKSFFSLWSFSIELEFATPGHEPPDSSGPRPKWSHGQGIKLRNSQGWVIFLQNPGVFGGTYFSKFMEKSYKYH